MGLCGRQGAGVAPGALRKTESRLLLWEAVVAMLGLGVLVPRKEVLVLQRPEANTLSSTA